MSINVTSQINIDQNRFAQKVKYWMKNNYDQCEDEKEYEADIKVLLQGYPTELGGLVAIRGFVYQYYVAIYYMLKMLHKKDAWWNKVVFELMDDITLLGENQVRFVQVKTVKEAGEVNNFTPGDLHKRERGELESWLDKLFLNYSKFENTCRDKVEISDITFEFEIATNNTYNKELSIYSNNSNFFIDDEVKLNKISTKLAVPCKKTGSILQDLIGKDIIWCLSHFHLNHMDRFLVLKDQIINIIKELSAQDSTDVAEHILKNIFYHVIERTQSDKVLNENEYIFTKTEVQQIIERSKPAAIRDARDYLHSQDIQSKFIQCIEELRNDFQQITSPVRIDLLQTLTWIQDELIKKSDQDVFVYVRFLHLLFDMKSSDSERNIKNLNELVALKKSLELMALFLTFYVDKQFLLSDASMITNQVIHQGNHREELRMFTLFHANQSTYFDIICKKVNETFEICPVLQNIHEQFYCLILGSKKRSMLKKPLGVTSITDNYQESEQIVITDKPPIIKYYAPEFLEEVQEYFYNLEEEISLRNLEVVESWHEFLEQNGNSTKRNDAV